MALNYPGLVERFREWLRKDEELLEAQRAYYTHEYTFIECTVIASNLTPFASDIDWELTADFATNPNGYRFVSKEENQ